MDSEIAFATALRPFAEGAWSRLGLEVTEVLAPSAGEDIRRHLLERLSGFAGRAMLQHYEQTSGGQAAAQGGTSRYVGYVERCRDDRCGSLFQAYPVLERLVRRGCADWVENTSRMVERFTIDRTQLGDLGWSGERIENVSGRLGDPHNGGQAVCALSGEGASVVYKPRSLRSDVLFTEVLAGCEALGLPLNLVHPRVIDSDGYGWVEFLAASAPSGHEAAERHDLRCGMLVCLARVLGITDLHLENVLAVGEYPALIDLECLAHPRKWVTDEARDGAWLAESVLGTRLLPIIDSREQPVAIDIAGLTANGGQTTGKWRRRWTGLGTDAIALAPALTHSQARVRLDGGRHRRPLVGALMTGHDAMYQVLRELDLDQIEVDGCKSRVIVRHTARYQEILWSATSAECLRSEQAVDAALATLLETSADSGDSGDLDWLPENVRSRIVRAESRSLRRMDIPLFRAGLQGRDLDLGNGVAATDVFAASPWSEVRERILALDEVDQRLQSDLISIAIEGSAPRKEREVAPPFVSSPLGAMQTGVDLADRILNHAIDRGDGSLGWLDAVSGEDHQAKIDGEYRRLVVPAVHARGLYRGSAGIAILLAAAASITQSSDLAQASRRSLGDPPESEGESSTLDRIDLASGLTGRAYAAVVVADLLDEPAPSANAWTSSLEFDNAMIAPGESLGLLTGWSGVLLGTIAVAERTPAADRTKAVRHLATAIATEVIRRDRAGEVPFHRRVGVAYGATGIAYAIARAASFCPDPNLDLAAAAIVEEENLRIERRGGIPARLVGRTRRPDVGWCWGTSGFAITRFALAGHIDPAIAMTHVDRALELTAAATHDQSGLCCGTPGIIEALACRPHVFSDLIESRVDRLCAEALDQTTVFEPGLSYQSPSLFRGIAGVSYTALRRVEPSLPNVLLLE